MTPTNTTPNMLQNEHAQLNREIEELRSWWQELRQIGSPHFGEMADRIHAFRDHLADHFQHEVSYRERAGATQLSKNAHERLAELHGQHDQFLEKLDRLQVRLSACEPGFDCWGDAGCAFDAILNDLEEHEANERDIFASEQAV